MSSPSIPDRHPLGAALSCLLMPGSVILSRGADFPENLWTLGRRHQGAECFRPVFAGLSPPNVLRLPLNESSRMKNIFAILIPRGCGKQRNQ